MHLERRSWPTLTALRMFEAAARLSSFSKAAGELSVSQAAVSRQVRLLEQGLNCQLFRRLPRTLTLTEEGRRYLPCVREALKLISEGTADLLAKERRSTLTVGTTLAFASLWLVPRLRSFVADHPEIDLRIAASDAVADLPHDGIDVAIRYGRGDWLGAKAELLLKEQVFPVCEPALLKSVRRVARPEDLQNLPLLCYEGAEGTFQDWQVWFKSMGLEAMEVQQPLGLNNYELLLKAARDGHGVILGTSYFVEEDLRAGSLVRPFGDLTMDGYGYYLVLPISRRPDHKVAAFLEWVKQLARRDLSPTAVPSPKENLSIS